MLCPVKKKKMYIYIYCCEFSAARLEWRPPRPPERTILSLPSRTNAGSYAVLLYDNFFCFFFQILKDITNRFHVMRGDRVHFMPGWDCHGLPIEMKALTEGEVLSHNLYPMETRQKAQKFAEETISKQKAAFIRWGVMADWDSGCYSTFEKEYVAKQLELFFDMYDKGYIYQAFKPVFWSPATKTALAEAELEYNDEHVSRATYVKFPLSKRPSKLSDVFGDVVVWTTQPWTIPANEAVCFLPNVNYCLAKCDSLGECLLVAVERVPSLADSLGMKLEVLQTFSGLKLEGGACRHPTIPMKEIPLLPSNHVTIEKGTGLVHIAPAHGMEDYNVASHHQLPVECLVNEDGIFTENAGEELVGKFVMEQGNLAVIEQLQNAGQLLKEEEHVHSFPYDWRAQCPVLIRASHQWFVDTSAILKHAALENVETHPKLARGSMQALLPQRTYWCISRQRSWGVPIPVFYSCQTHQALINKHTVQHVAKLVRDHGTDCWWTLPLQELLPNALLEKSGKSTEEEFERGVDIMDIWFDSGSSWASVLESVNHCSDLYLEGKDQLSGWFQSSLLLSCAANKRAPFRSLLVHGFATSEDGQKMSKSRGNVVDPMVVVNGGKDKIEEPAYGADVLRWWAAESNVYADVFVGPSVLKRTEDSVFGVRSYLVTFIEVYFCLLFQVLFYLLMNGTTVKSSYNKLISFVGLSIVNQNGHFIVIKLIIIISVPDETPKSAPSKVHHFKFAFASKAHFSSSALSTFTVSKGNEWQGHKK
uniref:isoleucine--tRNA ligase n=1 Tax=Eptatretus burgeri TaxID=7764 RepID=A0A8C4R000_EPTBU